MLKHTEHHVNIKTELEMYQLSAYFNQRTSLSLDKHSLWQAQVERKLGPCLTKTKSLHTVVFTYYHSLVSAD